MTKRKGILWAMGLISLALGVLSTRMTDRQGLDLLALPLAPIAAGLRRLSLLGGVWDLLAWALYAGVSLLPVLYLLRRVVKKRAAPCDALLAVLSGLTFWALYWMISPAAMGDFFGQMGGVSYPLMSTCLWATALCWGILRLCVCVRNAGNQGLRRWVSLFVWCLIAACFLDVFLIQLPAAVKGLQYDSPAGLMGLFARGVIDLMAVRTALHGLTLLESLADGWYSPGAIGAANGLSAVCGEAIAVSAVVQLLHTLLQVLLSSEAPSLELTLSLPVVQILLLLCVMLLSRMLVHGAQLQEDSDSII